MIQAKADAEENKMKSKVIVIANRKGGSGKTTTAKNLGYNLTSSGYRVLLVDCDPQCNMSDGLTGREYKRSILSLLKYENIHKCIYKTRFPGLDIIPGSDFLASEEIQDDVIKKQLDTVKEEYDYIIIDTSPYFNKLTVEILKAHDMVIIPTEINEDSLKGMITTMSELSMMFDNNVLFRILYTKIDATKETMRALESVQQELGSVSFKTFIHFNYIPVKRARERRIPLSKRYQHAKVTKDYEKLALELMEVL